MAVRIYSLAKELNIDNKELVSICEKAGLRGKGSALASLDDDEVIKVKKFISEQAETTPKNPEPSTGLEAVRPDKPTRPKGQMRDLSAKQRLLQKAKPKPKPVEVEAEVEAEVESEEEVQVEEKPAKVEPVAEQPATTADPQRKEMMRPQRRAPIRDLSRKGKKSKPAGEDKKEPKKRAPVVNVAAMPQVQQPVQKKRNGRKGSKTRYRIAARRDQESQVRCFCPAGTIYRYE